MKRVKKSSYLENYLTVTMVWILVGGGGGDNILYLENRGAEAVEAVGQSVQRFQGVFTIVASVVRCSVPQHNN